MSHYLGGVKDYDAAGENEEMIVSLKAGLWTCGMVTLLTVVACGGDDEANTGAGDVGDGVGQNTSPQCAGGTYVAFDSANYAKQGTRLLAHAEMVSTVKPAGTDISKASLFVDARAMYTDETVSANLRAKVQGRKDDHVDPAALQGDRMDAAIMSAFDTGEAATETVGAQVAKQVIDKTLIEFFYLSVYHEMLLGQRKKWDEAFGYFGSGAENDEGGLRGLAAVALKRDSSNGTNLGTELFNDFIDGSCELDKALTEAGTEEIDPMATPALATIIERIDDNMQKVIAYSAGHEAFEMNEIIVEGFDSTDADDVSRFWVKYAELLSYFKPLETQMNNRGGDSAARAAEIAGYLSVADMDDLAAIDWMDGIATAASGDSAASRIVELLSVEYGIDITK